MVLKLYEIAKKMKIDLPDLLTRPTGRKIYKKSIEKIKYAGDNETILIDLEGIKVMDSSFIDEFLIKLLLNSVNDKKYYIKLKNISNISEINIDSVLKTYTDYNKKILILTDDICQNNNFYIGELNSSEREVLNFLRINKSANIKDIIDFSRQNEEKIIKILDALYSFRLIKIDHGVYYFL